MQLWVGSDYGWNELGLGLDGLRLYGLGLGLMLDRLVFDELAFFSQAQAFITTFKSSSPHLKRGLFRRPGQVMYTTF